MEFVQFHPTVLWQDSARGQCPLITEALRGAGAVLVDAAGRPVMPGRHPLGDLAPRDVVAAAMQQRMEEGDGPGDHLWLDATTLGRAVLERDFPTVAGLCRARGIDPATEPIPVAPGAHYACGGIAASMDGQTSVPGLYAVGEAASTGVHGANRLASNSLTEALITGRRTGDLLGQDLRLAARQAAAASLRPGGDPCPAAGPGRGHVPARRGVTRPRGPGTPAADPGPGPARARAAEHRDRRGGQPACGLGPGRGGRPRPHGEPRLPPAAGRPAGRRRAGRARHTVVRPEAGLRGQAGSVRAGVGAGA